MCQIALAYIRRSVDIDNIAFSQHAINRMSEREIPVENVLACIKKGKLHRVQDLEDKDRQLIFVDEKEGFCVVVAACCPCTVVTVYWDTESDR